MAVIPASMQQISSRTTPTGGEANPFLTLLSAFGQGMLDKQKLPQTQFNSAFPTLAQMNMVAPSTQGIPGSMPYGGQWWLPRDQPTSATDELANVRAKEVLRKGGNALSHNEALGFAIQSLDPLGDLPGRVPGTALNILKFARELQEQPEAGTKVDPMAVATKIKELRKKGIKDKTIYEFLKEKNLNPELYGVKNV
jgi:hypothetical protein